MAKIISASIDVSKIDKNRLQTVDKDGNPFKNGAKYLNITITVNDEPDKFGKDVSIAEGQTKEEREAKAKKNFIGNGKVVWQKERSQKASDPEQTNTSSVTSDDLPF